MQVDLLELLKTQMDSLGIQLLLLKEPYDNFADIDYQFTMHLFKGFRYDNAFRKLCGFCENGCVLHFQEYFYLHYFFFRFPEKERQQYDYEYGLVGPLVFESLSDNAFRQFLSYFQLPPDYLNEVKEFYNRVPHIPSRDLVHAILRTLLRELFGEVYFKTLNTMHYGTFIFDYQDYIVNESNAYSLEAVEARYKIENLFLAAVQQGRVDDALIHHHHLEEFKLAPRHADPVRAKKNLMFVTNSLCRKTVEQAQVHPYHIDILSTQLALAIENADNLNQLEELHRSIIRKYCMLVNNYSQKRYSPIIQSCINHIESHYREPLSLSVLAAHCASNPSYLSQLFKKETSHTVTHYILKTRINHSLLLLNSSGLSINEIALHCGFPDANYYSKAFKKIKGQTPSDYRKEIFG